STLITLDELPLTSNGKLDHDALPPPAAMNRLQDHPHVPPRTDREKQLAGIFQHVLQCDHMGGVGIHDNFFEIGGDSLSCLGVIFTAEEKGLYFTVDMLRRLTLAQLAEQAGTDFKTPEAKL